MRGHIVKALNLRALGAFMVGVGLFGFLASAFLNGQLGGQGPGTWDVVQEALKIESHLSGYYMDVYSLSDPGMQDALTYWHRICAWHSGQLCDNARPSGWLMVNPKNNQYEQCASTQAACVYYGRDSALQCVAFVTAAYGAAGHPLPDINENGGDFFGAYAHMSGWQEVRVGTGLPLPGDLLGMSGGAFGHIAIVVSVTLPSINAPGSIVIAQANAPGNLVTPSPYAPGITTPGIHLLRLPLMPDLSVPTIWGDYQVQGYIRNPSLVKYGWRSGNASQRLVRIFQGDPKQYNSQYPVNTWWPSTCSAAAMTEVLNAYGGHYRIADILKVEATSPISAITSTGGLQRESGIADTMKQFGFQTDWGNDPSISRLQDIVSLANAGTPVMVSFPPLHWAGGHILVVIGGDMRQDNPRGGPSGVIFLADSSSYDMKSMPVSSFLYYWQDVPISAGGGFYAISVPVNMQSGGMPAGMPNSPWVYVAYNDALKYGINTTYFLRQIKQESGFNPSALSNKGAEGIAQFLPATAQEYGIDPWDPTQALDGAARLMAQNYQKYLAWTPGDPTTAYARALAEYNAGAGAVAPTPFWFSRLPAQTQHYIDVIMGVNW